MQTWQRIIIVLLLGSGLITSDVSRAERDRPFRIGALTMSWGPTPSIVGLRDGLLELGYREEADFVIGVRFTQGDLTALPEAARELLELEVDVIVTSSDQATKAAQRVTTAIPIVFTSVADPEGLGSIQSFARPGGNVTGVTDMESQLGAKRLQVFKEIVPNLKRVLFAHGAADSYGVKMADTYREASRRLGIDLVVKPVSTESEAQETFAQVHEIGVDGILNPWATSFNIMGLIMETEARQAIPAMYGTSFYPQRGGFVSYGSDSYQTGKLAARLVDKIFKGGKPAEIPVEVNSRIELVINLKTAKKLGLTISPEVLFQADKLIR